MRTVMRRTKEQVQTARELEWLICKTEWYAQFDTCCKCGEHAYIAGRRRDTMRCKSCHMSGA